MFKCDQCPLMYTLKDSLLRHGKTFMPERQPQLVNKGFVYTTDKIKEDKHICKSVHYNRHKCLGRVWKAEDIVIYENEKHNHVPDVAEIRVKEVMASIKQKAETVMDTPPQILASVTSSLPAAVAGILPPFAGIKRNILKARPKGSGSYVLPLYHA
ncbi:hypothetical protein ACI65C_006827 [Semiaphis heraclei]